MRQFVLGETIAGKYRLNRQIAKGGMGAVWSAWNVQLEVPVAIKFMAGDAIGSSELVARFEREAKSAAQLRSPQVVHIYEHGVVDGVPYMVMELLEGEDLGARLRARGRLALPETARILGEVCKALRRAHELGIIHRDLKPGNVFLSRNHDEEVVKVLDFGIAKLMTPTNASEATKTGALIGTPHYMSPEQARRTNHAVDQRSDLWALGIIAFRAIAGKLPFAGDDPIDVLVRICTQAPPAASSIAPDLGPAVDRFFERALAFEPGQRFQNARDFADALNALAGRSSVHEAPSLAQPWSGAPGPPRNDSGRAAAPVAAAAAMPAAAGSASGGQPGGRPPAGQGVVYAGAAAARPEPAASGGHSEFLPTMARSPHYVEAPDALDGAQTVPLNRSPAGQAALRAVAGIGAGAGIGADAPQAAFAPNGTMPLPANLFGPAGRQSFADGPGGGWPPSGQQQTQPLPKMQQGPQGAPRPPLQSEPRVLIAVGAQAPAPMAVGPPVSAPSAASESPATITSATADLPAPGARRPPLVAWGLAAAVLLVVAVVGGVVVTNLSASSESGAETTPMIPLPATEPVSVTASPPPTGAAPPTAPASATSGDAAPSGAAAIASAVPSTSAAAIASAAPSASASGSASAKKGPYQGPSSIFAPPVFGK